MATIRVQKNDEDAEAIADILVEEAIDRLRFKGGTVYAIDRIIFYLDERRKEERAKEDEERKARKR